MHLSSMCVCVRVSAMPSDFSGIHGSMLDQNNLFELPGASMFASEEQLDAAAGVSFGSSRCA